MNRRDALRLLAAGAALPLMPHPLLASLREARALFGTPATGPAAAPRTLNAHQEATVKTMAELILPRSDTAGATDVGAAEFIDLMLTEWCDEPQRAMFLNGLADVDARSRELFAKDFVDCVSLQQADLLTALGEEMTEQASRIRDQVAHGRGAAQAAPRSFYAMLRRLTLTAYYTSEAGATEELHFEIVPGHYDGSAEAGISKAPESQ